MSRSAACSLYHRLHRCFEPASQSELDISADAIGAGIKLQLGISSAVASVPFDECPGGCAVSMIRTGW